MNYRRLILSGFISVIITIVACTAYLSVSIGSKLRDVNLINTLSTGDTEHDKRVREILVHKESLPKQ